MRGDTAATKVILIVRTKQPVWLGFASGTWWGWGPRQRPGRCGLSIWYGWAAWLRIQRRIAGLVTISSVRNRRNSIRGCLLEGGIYYCVCCSCFYGRSLASPFFLELSNYNQPRIAGQYFKLIIKLPWLKEAETCRWLTFKGTKGLQGRYSKDFSVYVIPACPTGVILLTVVELLQGVISYHRE